MDAKELRIGNYVWANGDAAQITSIAPHLCWVRFLIWEDGRSDELEIDIENMKPIPLTEQWLLDFGFETTSIRTYKLPNTRGLVIISKMKGEFLIKLNTNTIWIKHVHQLQNLYFALTGEELMLKKNMDI